MVLATRVVGVGRPLARCVALPHAAFSNSSKPNVRVQKTRKLNANGPSLAHFLQEHRQNSHPELTLKDDDSYTSQMSVPASMLPMARTEDQDQKQYTQEQQLMSHPRRKNFYIETYGCQMNSSDSEIVRSILIKDGYKAVLNEDDADVILLNTCAIREHAETRIWNRLEQFRRLKTKILTKYKKTASERMPTVGVLGCMAERLKTKLLESDKMVDLVVGPDAYRDIPNLLNVVRGGNKAVNVQLSLDETYADIAPVRSDPSNSSAFVSIMRGCNNMCSYCIVPFTRGRERSRHMQSILDEIKVLRDQEVKEIVLLGQNVNSYHDKHSEGASEQGRRYVSAQGFQNMFQLRHEPGFRFVDLLDKASLIDPEIRFRFTSPHPKDFPNEVFDLMRERHNICKSVHMPAQSGSSSVLARMRRGYTREAYVDLVDNMRARIPGIALSSDFISGFCGESEQEHEDTLSLMRRVGFDLAYMFAYSLRAKTHAAHRLQDDVPQEIKIRRLQEVIETFGQVVTVKNRLEDTDRLHVVLVQGPSRRVSLDQPKLTGLTDTNKRCVFADVPLPSSLKQLQQLHGDSTSLAPFVPLDHHNASVLGSAQAGEYVLVRVHEAGRHTLHATPIARTTLAEVTALVAQDQLGARPFDLDAIQRALQAQGTGQ